MKRLSVILAFVAVAVCFSSCKINRQDKMIGYWKQVPFSDPDSVETMKFWTFYDGDVLEVVTVKPKTDSTQNGQLASYLPGSMPKTKEDLNNCDTVELTQFTYTTEGKELSIFLPGEDSDSKYIVGSHSICGEYWLDELKKGKRMKMVRRRQPGGEKGGAYLRIELVKL